MFECGPLKTGIAFLFIASAFVHAETCPPLMKTLEQVDRHDATVLIHKWSEALERATLLREHLESSRVEPALRRVVVNRMRSTEPPLQFISDETPIDVDFELFWNRKIEKASNSFPSYGTAQGPLPLSRVGSPMGSTVYRVQLKDGNIAYFRPLVAEGFRSSVARHTIAVAHVRQLLGLETVPRSGLVKVNGFIGVLSREAPGRIPAKKYRYLKPFLNQRNLSDVEVFEFLVGNADAHNRNFNIDRNRTIQVFDHDMTFVKGVLPLLNLSNVPFGRTLPKKYRREVINKLHALTPKKLRKELSMHLNSQEIEGVLLRREVILEDVAIRGESAFFN